MNDTRQTGERPRVVTIIHTSDTHSRHDELPVLAGELLVHSGDLTGDGSINQLLAGLDWMAAQPCPGRLLVPGNHDRYAFDHPDWMAEECRKRSIVCLPDGGAELRGLWVHGLSWVARRPEWAWPESDSAWASDDTDFLRARTESIPPGVDVLVCHQVPQDLGDQVDGLSYWAGLGERRPGNPWLREKLDRTPRPGLILAGHIHENPGIQRYGGSWAINSAGSVSWLEYDTASRKLRSCRQETILEFS